MWKIVVQACKLQVVLIYFLFSSPDEEVEKRIYQFFSLFSKILTEAGIYIISWSHKGDEGDETDLMIQFCVPYVKHPRIYCGYKIPSNLVSLLAIANQYKVSLRLELCFHA